LHWLAQSGAVLRAHDAQRSSGAPVLDRIAVRRCVSFVGAGVDNCDKPTRRRSGVETHAADTGLHRSTVLRTNLKSRPRPTHPQENKMSSKTLRTLGLAAAIVAVTGGAQAQTMLGSGKNATSFPIVINQPGSYKLAANLTVSDPAAAAILINVPNVTIDLNGFHIQGPNSCTSDWTTKAVTCALPFNETASGILSKEGVTFNVNVSNGSVRGFAGHGVRVVGNLTDLGASHNSGSGIVGNSGTMTRVNAVFNMSTGIAVSYGSLVHGMAQSNGGDGISAWKSVVMTSSSAANKGYGLNGLYSALSNNALIENKAGGLSGGGSVATTNVCNASPC
jgi:hypothetical protein